MPLEQRNPEDVEEEINRLFDHLTGTYALMGGLLYGTGMRLMECIRLRVADVDFDLGQSGRQLGVRSPVDM